METGVKGNLTQEGSLLYSHGKHHTADFPVIASRPQLPSVVLTMCKQKIEIPYLVIGVQDCYGNSGP